MTVEATFFGRYRHIVPPGGTQHQQEDRRVPPEDFPTLDQLDGLQYVDFGNYPLARWASLDMQKDGVPARTRRFKTCCSHVSVLPYTSDVGPALAPESLLGGSWVVMSNVVGRITIVITYIRELITPLITTHEPPSTTRISAPDPKTSDQVLPQPRSPTS